METAVKEDWESYQTPAAHRLGIDLFDTDYLYALRREAEFHAKVGGLNLGWKRAYERIADAMDDLEGKERRRVVVQPEQP